MKKPKDIDAYLADIPEEAREPLQKLRVSVGGLVPDATEAISYGLPTYKYKGKSLIHFGAAKSHVAIYGAIPGAMSEKELDRYDTSKGTIRFPLGKPVPPALVKRLVKARKAEIDAATPAKKVATRAR
jgi:uncharacterized protein YdhG (YjbR/CyaY superfamily)